MHIPNHLKIILLGLLSLLPLLLFANAAQPGIRNAGGMGSFTLLFPEDSLAYQKIQMQKEKISIQLYKGFAVVKGEYWMYNEGSEDITMQSGYPIQAAYNTEKNGYKLTEIHFDTLYQLLVNIDGQIVKTQATNYEPENNRINHYNNYETDSKWHTWETVYKANGITKIEVYFILETNNGNIAEGYDRQRYNSFIYVLETGATWKPPIGEGTINIALMDGLTSKDIQGISPNAVFKIDKEKDILCYSFKDLKPTNEDNIAITYHERNEDFNFKEIVEKSEIYFKKINDFSNKDIDTNLTDIVFDSPFDIPDTTAKVLGGIFFGGIALVVVVFSLIIYFIVRLVRKK